jgi:dimethylargininase
MDLNIVRQQHFAYQDALRSLGVNVVCLLELPDMPDAVFIEDTAIVLDECAILTRPGAVSRRAEVDSVADVLSAYRDLFRISYPGTLDGGDVLVIDKDVFVGLTNRSNQEGIDQLQKILLPYNYQVHSVLVQDCLHLKSAVTRVAEDTLLVNNAWVSTDQLPDMNIIDIDPSEPFAANALKIGDYVLYQPFFLKTRRRLEAEGIRLCLVDQSELLKAEGALTCCSLVFKDSPQI